MVVSFAFNVLARTHLIGSAIFKDFWAWGPFCAQDSDNAILTVLKTLARFFLRIMLPFGACFYALASRYRAWRESNDLWVEFQGIESVSSKVEFLVLKLIDPLLCEETLGVIQRMDFFKLRDLHRYMERNARGDEAHESLKTQLAQTLKSKNSCVKP